MTEMPKCQTSMDALVQAMERAVGPHCDYLVRLDNVMFGRYSAVEAGWYWELTVSRTYASDPKLVRADDTPARRIKMIAEAWLKTSAVHEELVT